MNNENKKGVLTLKMDCLRSEMIPRPQKVKNSERQKRMNANEAVLDRNDMEREVPNYG